MEALGAATAVIAVVETTARIVEICQKYITAVRKARTDINRLSAQVIAFQQALISVADIIEDKNQASKLSISKILRTDGKFMTDCRGIVDHILNILEKEYNSGQIKKFGLHALKWPFDAKEIDELLATLADYKSTIQVAISTDILPVAISTHAVVTLTAENSDWTRIESWLAAPDPSVNFQTADKKRLNGTGKWFLQGTPFQEWKTRRGAILWLTGMPGSGKTVLSSSIIGGVLRYIDRTPYHGVLAFFFFDYKDEAKREPDRCIRSLLLQLAHQFKTVPSVLLDLEVECKNTGVRQPGSKSLLSILHEIASGLKKDVYVVLDALDECVDYAELGLLLENISTWPRVHLLLTSRRHPALMQTIGGLGATEIPLQTNLIDNDIELYVYNVVQYDPQLKTWPAPVQKKIQTVLVREGNGMFRWVACQLDNLRKCITLHALEKALTSLPTTLDETYDRILQGIDEMYYNESLIVLQSIAFAYRPLTLDEVNDAQSIQGHENKLSFDPFRRLRNSRDVLVLTSTLATITETAGMDYQSHKPDITINFTHYSVKEYLLSSRITRGPAKQYALDESSTHAHLAKACLTYLLQDGLRDGPCTSADAMSRRLQEFPFLIYAARYWPYHANSVNVWDLALQNIVNTLFQSPSTYFHSWAQVLGVRMNWPDSYRRYRHVAKPTPLYYAASFGLKNTVQHLLSNGADPNEGGGFFGGTPLHAAFYRQHAAVAALLLQAGADPNITDVSHMSALDLGMHYLEGSLRVPAGVKKNQDGTKSDVSSSSLDPLSTIIYSLLDQHSNKKGPYLLTQ